MTTSHLDLPRFDVTIHMQALTAAPLHVGAGANGNIAEMWRADLRVEDPTAPAGYEWRRLRVPGVPGRSLRGVLRDIAMTQFCELAGLRTDNRDVLRLLFKGGKLSKSNGGVDLAMLGWLREHCPPLALFGYMDDAGSARGLLQVGDLLAWTSEGVQAGAQPHTLRVLDAAGGPAEDVPLFPGRKPIPVSECASEETGYRRDLMGSGATAYLGPESRKQIEERAVQVKQSEGPVSKEARREANESMPWTVKVVPTGVPLYGRLDAKGITEIEYAALAMVLAGWSSGGCQVGGKGAAGFGRLTLLGVPAVRLDYSPGVVQQQGRMVPDGLAPGQAEINAYRAWVQSRAERIRAWAGA